MRNISITLRRQTLVSLVFLLLMNGGMARAIDEAEWFAIYRKAEALKMQAKYREALTHFEQALRSVPEIFGANHENTAVVLNQIANVYMDMGEYPKSEQMHRRVLAFREATHGKNSTEVGESLNNLGLVYEKMGQYDKAEPLYRRSVAIYEAARGKNSVVVANCLTNLANLYWNKGNYAKAEPLHLRILAIREAALGKNHLDVAQSLNNLALLYVDMSDYEKAEPLQRRSLAIAEAKLSKNHPLLSDYLNNQGNLYWKMGQNTKAEQAYRRSLEIREAVLDKNHPAIGASLNNLGIQYMELGLYAKAEPLFRRSLEIAEARLGKDHPSVARSLTNLGNMYREMGQYARAEPLYHRSLEIRAAKFGKDHPEVAASLNNLALVFKDMAQYTKAEPLYRRSLEIYEAKFGKDHPGVAHALNNLAVLYLEMGEYPKAEPLFRRSLEIKEAKFGKDHTEVARSLSNLGNLYRSMGQRAKAEPLYRRSLEIYEAKQGKDHTDVAATLNNLANLYLDKRQSAKAEPLLRRCLAIRELKYGKDHPETANALNNLGILKAAEQKWDEAAELFQGERRCVRRHVAQVLPSLSPAEQNAYLHASDETSFHIALMLGWQQRGEKQNANERSAGWLLNGKAVADEALAARALLERDDADPKRRPIVVELKSIRQERASVALSESKPGQDQVRQRRLDQLEQHQQELEKQLAQLGGLAEPRADPWVDVAEVRKSIPADGVFIDIIRFFPYNFAAKMGESYWRPARFAVWVVPPAGKGEVRIVDLGPADKIEDAIRAVRADFRAAQNPDRSQNPIAIDEQAAEKATRGKLEAVAKLILHPLLTDIGTSKQWILSPDSSLWLLPWAALPLPDGSYAVEKYTLRYVISGRDLLQQPGKVQARQPLILADPDYDLDVAACRAAVRELVENRAEDSDRTIFSSSQLPQVARLPGTAAEAAAVKPLLQRYAGIEPWLYKGKNAQEAVFKTFKNPKVVLLSTHGYFLEDQVVAPSDKAATDSAPARTKDGKPLENPLLRCGLLLAGCNDHGPRKASDEDGVLTGLEIVGCDLRGTELVVLSACETGLGDVHNGQGVAGLRQAFQLAGAQAVLATLWQVPDRDSALLMIDFFNNLSKKHDKAAALRDAQLARIKARRARNGTAHPYFWAAFTLTGQ